MSSYLYGETLPKPTNKTSAKLLERLCNSLALLPTKIWRTQTTMFACVLCGKDITVSDEYKNGGYAKRAHVFCLRETVSRIQLVLH